MLDDDISSLKNELIDYMINAKLISELIGDKFGNYGINLLTFSCPESTPSNRWYEIPSYHTWDKGSSQEP